MRFQDFFEVKYEHDIYLLEDRIDEYPARGGPRPPTGV